MIISQSERISSFSVARTPTSSKSAFAFCHFRNSPLVFSFYKHTLIDKTDQTDSIIPNVLKGCSRCYSTLRIADIRIVDVSAQLAFILVFTRPLSLAVYTDQFRYFCDKLIFVHAGRFAHFCDCCFLLHHLSEGAVQHREPIVHLRDFIPEPRVFL